MRMYVCMYIFAYVCIDLVAKFAKTCRINNCIYVNKSVKLLGVEK